MSYKSLLSFGKQSRLICKVHGLVLVFAVQRSLEVKEDPSRLVGFSGKCNVNCLTIYLNPLRLRRVYTVIRFAENETKCIFTSLDQNLIFV